MDPSALNQTRKRIQEDPRSGQSLLLYALVKTLSNPRGGHPYLLTKLREMNPDTRQLAYGLLELMAQGVNSRPEWHDAVADMDTAIGG